MPASKHDCAVQTRFSHPHCSLAQSQPFQKLSSLFRHLKSGQSPDMPLSKVQSGKRNNCHLSGIRLGMFKEGLKRADSSLPRCQSDDAGDSDHSMSTDHEAVSSELHKAASSALKELQKTGNIKKASDDINRAMKHATNLEESATKAVSQAPTRAVTTRHGNLKEKREELSRMDAKRSWFHKIAEKKEKRLEERRKELGIEKPPPLQPQHPGNAAFPQGTMPQQMMQHQMGSMPPGMGPLMPPHMMPGAVNPMNPMQPMTQPQTQLPMQGAGMQMPMPNVLPAANPAAPLQAAGMQMPIPGMPVQPAPRVQVPKAISQQSLLMQNHYQMLMNDRLLSSLNVPEHVRQAALRPPGCASKGQSNSAASSASSPSFNVPSFIGGKPAVRWRSASEKSSSTEVPETPRSPPDLGMHSFAVWRS